MSDAPASSRRNTRGTVRSQKQLEGKGNHPQLWDPTSRRHGRMSTSARKCRDSPEVLSQRVLDDRNSEMMI